MKKIFYFIFILLLWLLGSLLFKYDPVYYELLNTPSYVINPTLNSIIWIILYFTISTSIIMVKSKRNIIGNNDYFFILIINYLANMIFPLMFYNLKSPFLGFIMNTIVLISTFYLLLESKKIDKRSFYVLIPYFIYTIYLFIISLSIWIMNF